MFHMLLVICTLLSSITVMIILYLQVELLRQSDQHPNVVRYFCMVSVMTVITVLLSFYPHKNIHSKLQIAYCRLVLHLMIHVTGSSLLFCYI